RQQEACDHHPAERRAHRVRLDGGGDGGDEGEGGAEIAGHLVGGDDQEQQGAEAAEQQRRRGWEPGQQRHQEGCAEHRHDVLGTDPDRQRPGQALFGLDDGVGGDGAAIAMQSPAEHGSPRGFRARSDPIGRRDPVELTTHAAGKGFFRARSSVTSGTRSSRDLRPASRVRKSANILTRSGAPNSSRTGTSAAATPIASATPPVTRPAPTPIARELTMTARNPTTTSTRPAITPLARARSAGRPSRARRPNNDTAAKQAHTAAPSRCTTWPPGAASPVREAITASRCHTTAAVCITALNSKARTV